MLVSLEAPIKALSVGSPFIEPSIKAPAPLVDVPPIEALPKEVEL
jgi:hypothetical protein